MKAIVCSNYWGPEVFRLVEVTKPTCGKNELLIQVMEAFDGILTSVSYRRGAIIYASNAT
ncbi:hypothetical protein [Cyclobacterium roseum]|uniref:hypothetical protein n=1 Tax=Cyclobacterium roseum TaxID=2666137 RepID=UPI001390ED3E|nr:hypothetical protein [Cyclobacterium roseum]